MLVAEQLTVGSAPYLCREWKKTSGNCKYGVHCKFLHPTLDLSIDISVSRQNRTKNSAGKAKRIKKKNVQRNKIFCYWLVKEFKLKELNSGNGVLDIAGGQGEVSFILKNIFQISSTIIDPRGKIDYSKFEVKLKSGNYHSKEMNEKNDRNTFQSHSIEYPTHVQLFFTPILWECVQDLECTCIQENYEKEYSVFLDFKLSTEYKKNVYFESLLMHAKYCWNPKTLLSSKNKKNIVKEKVEETGAAADSVSCSFDLEEVSNTMDYVYELFTSFSCIIGMHPDQATEAIVDFALLCNKPFAIIPCCVCSKQFTKRMHNGKVVKNYEELIDHLLSKSDKIQTAILPFSGKNKVLFYHPPE